jgi:geranylgeranyl pyrophosphate synthase
MDGETKAVGVALEIAHSAILARDDVIDGDTQRNGQSTIHSLAALQGYAGDGAAAVAHFTADCLFGLAPIPILAARIPEYSKIELLKILQSNTIATAEGQVDEVHLNNQPLCDLTQDQIEAAYCAKTNPTAAELPLVMGAVSARASTHTVEVLRNASRPLALAFQVLNDLVGYDTLLSSSMEAARFNPRSLMLLLHRAYQSSDSSTKQALERAFDKEICQFAEVADILITHDVATQQRQYVQNLFSHAASHLDELHDMELRERVSRLFQFLALLYEPGSVYWKGIGGYQQVR